MSNREMIDEHGGLENVLRLTIEGILRIEIERTGDVKVFVVENIVALEETSENGIAVFEHRPAELVGTARGHVMETLQVIVETTGFAFARANVVNRENAEQTGTSQRTTTAIDRHGLTQTARSITSQRGTFTATVVILEEPTDGQERCQRAFLLNQLHRESLKC